MILVTVYYIIASLYTMDWALEMAIKKPFIGNKLSIIDIIGIWIVAWFGGWMLFPIIYIMKRL
jgi:hypothetical protein